MRVLLVSLTLFSGLILSDASIAEPIPESLTNAIEKFYECAKSTDRSEWVAEMDFLPIRVCGAKVHFSRDVFLKSHSCLANPRTLSLHKTEKNGADDYVEYFLEFHCRKKILSMNIREYSDKVLIDSVGEMST